MSLTVYIGYDPSEREAYRVARWSIEKHCAGAVRIVPLDLRALTSHGLLNRPTTRIRGGQLWDVLSDAPMSTEFAISRFLTPILNQAGWAVFMDCDVVVYRDIHEILPREPGAAVYCVQHEYEPTEATKMCGLAQTRYARKNWSSVMLFDCDHPANKELTLNDINRLPGRELHGFSWLAEEEIGELDAGWNWLVNVQDRPEQLNLAHFTLGGPWLDGWDEQPHDDMWVQAHREMRSETLGVAA